MTGHDPRAEERRSDRRATALVVAAALLAFLPALPGGFAWDDLDLIRDNPWVHRPPGFFTLVTTPYMDGLLEGPDVMPVYHWLHRPLTKLVLVAEYALFGGAPIGFHATNLVLHALASVFVARFLRGRLRGLSAESARSAATVGALLFALHPSRVESVAWISGLPDPLMACLLVPALMVLGAATTAPRLIAGAVLVALAGFAREVAVVAPLLVASEGLLASVDRRTLVRRVAAASAGALCVLVGIAGVARQAPHLTALEGGFALARVTATFGGYAARIVAPEPATLWPFPLVIAPSGVPLYPQVLVILGGVVILALILVVGLCIGRRVGAEVVADLALLVLPLLPAANLVLRSLDSLTTDRYLYLPMIGLGALLGRAVAAAIARGDVGRSLAQLASAALLLACGVLSFQSSERFSSNERLFEHELAVHPTSFHAFRTLVPALADAGETARARRLASRAASLARTQGRPEDELRFVATYAGLELVRLPEARQTELRAIRHFFDALALGAPLRLDDASVHYAADAPASLRSRVCGDVLLCALNRARSYVATLDLEASLPMLEFVTRTRPRSGAGWSLLAVVQARLGRYADASQTLERARRAVGASSAIDAAARAIAAAREASARPTSGPDEVRLHAAEAALILGSPEQVRRTLRPILASGRADARVVLLSAQAELQDERPDVARALLEDALRRSPQDAALAEGRRRLGQR